MKLRGSMTIELTDVNTGEVETAAEENMVTTAVNNILGLNPMGVFYEVGESIDGIKRHSGLLPICPNMIGGIVVLKTAGGAGGEYLSHVR